MISDDISYVKNEKMELYLPRPKKYGEYVNNPAEIIKQMKINHSGFTNNTLGQFIEKSDWDLKTKCACIIKWERKDGANFDMFNKFFENFTHRYGYQFEIENQKVQLIEGIGIKSIRHRGEKNCRVELDDGKEAIIPTNLAREGVYIQQKKIKFNQKKNCYDYNEIT